MDPFKNQEELTISIISNANQGHPENTLFSFTNELAIPLYTPPNEECEVALQSLAVSNLLEKGALVEQEMKELPDTGEVPF